ncbi:GNAT family N-acetyltransferase [Glutamicibacter protophormiae]|uniref:GNAT family N-acetyltransferase n=1 Tax=Glutamicibacter protophormiae TaxID=37930 RepID=UPI003A8ECBB9
MSDELISKEPDAARQFATTHRILAALFVLPEARGSGIGRELLSEAAYWALPHGGRYLDGFVDDRNNSADFYRRSGATVVGHNTGLPARRPTNSELSHYPGIDGTWFYVDAWRMHQGKINCARCRDVFEFVDEDGGYLLCPNCGTPEAK